MIAESRRAQFQMSGLGGKIRDAQRHLSQAVRDFKKPVILTSFGKESLALQSLAEMCNLQIDMAYFEYGFNTRKHEFAHSCVEKLQTEIVFLKPHETLRVKREDRIALAYRFKLRSGADFKILAPEFHERDSDTRCAIQAGVVKSGVHEAYPWDALVVGRRSSDVDNSLGSLHWREHKYATGDDVAVIMPLLDWSDQELYHFLRHAGRMPDPDRYEIIQNTIVNRAGLAANPDQAEFCIRCLNSDKGAAVTCPKWENKVRTIANLRKQDVSKNGEVIPAVLC